MPVLKCHCPEVHTTCGQHRRTGWEKHQLTKTCSDKDDAKYPCCFQSCILKKLNVRFSFLSGNRKKTDVTLLFFVIGT